MRLKSFPRFFQANSFSKTQNVLRGYQHQICLSKYITKCSSPEKKQHFLGTYLYLHLVVLSRVPNLQHISLQLHNVCSHLDYLTLLTDGLVPINKTNKKIEEIHPPSLQAVLIYLIIILVRINCNTETYIEIV